MEPRRLESSGTARSGSTSHAGADFEIGKFYPVRLYMKKSGCFSLSVATIRRVAEGIGVAVLLMTTGMALGQNAAPGTPFSAPDASSSAVPSGYSVHESVDLGGHMVGRTGSGAMYDTMVNMRSGPRMLGETFEMRALPGNKNHHVRCAHGVQHRLRRRPGQLRKLNFYKGKLYEFSGIFRRDRQYFDYDLLGNPNILSGLSTPIGPTGSPTGSLPWSQENQSPFMYNTVRRMTDTQPHAFAALEGDLPGRVLAEHLCRAQPDAERLSVRRLLRCRGPGDAAQQHRRFHGRDRLEARAGHQADV
jgi:hypothetical protein